MSEPNFHQHSRVECKLQGSTSVAFELHFPRALVLTFLWCHKFLSHQIGNPSHGFFFPLQTALGLPPLMPLCLPLPLPASLERKHRKSISNERNESIERKVLRNNSIQQCEKQNDNIHICMLTTLRCANAGRWTAGQYWLYVQRPAFAQRFWRTICPNIAK